MTQTKSALTLFSSCSFDSGDNMFMTKGVFSLNNLSPFNIVTSTSFFCSSGAQQLQSSSTVVSLKD